MKDPSAILPIGSWKSLIFQLFPRVMSLMMEWKSQRRLHAIMVACLALEAIMKDQSWTVQHSRSRSNSNGYRLWSRGEPESASLCVKICKYGFGVTSVHLPFCFRYIDLLLWRVWHVCDLPCGVYALLRLISIAKYVLKSQSVRFQFEGQSSKYSVRMFQRKVDKNNKPGGMTFW